MSDKPFNLFAHRLHDFGEKMFDVVAQPTGRFDKLIMPDHDGVMRTPAPTNWHWYGIRWPVNPWDTGERGILEMLNHLFKDRRIGDVPDVKGSRVDRDATEQHDPGNTLRAQVQGDPA